MTSFADKLKQRLTEVADQVSSAIEVVTSIEAEQRLDICKGCPELTHLTHQCKLCGCFMLAKTKLKSASCPINKW
jgi:hypothetical protein